MINARLHYFVSTVEAGSLSAAARKHDVSQSALSQMMKKIEVELGATILVRGRRQIKLTEAGNVYYEYAKQILSLSKNCSQEIQNLNQGVAGTLKFGVLESVLLHIISEPIVKCANRYPRMNLEFTKAASSNIENKVISGDCHFGFTSRKCTDNRIISEKLKSYSINLVCSSDFSYEEYLNRLILLGKWQEDLVRGQTSILQDYGFKSIFYGNNHLQLIQQLVTMKFGCALMPSFIKSKELKILNTYDEMKMDLFLIKAKTRIPKIADNFIEIVCESLA